jgi:PAS domain S-box-containing protein
MVLENPLVLGAILAGGGLIFWVLAAFVLRRGQPHKRESRGLNPQIADNLNGYKDGLLIIQPGGKLVWANLAARQVFEIEANETPDLENLVRKTRPAEALLELCAQDGHTRLILSGRPVEASSYLLPLQPEGYRVVSLRFSDLAAGLISDTNTIPADILQVFIELSQTIAASLDLEETLRTILESLERLLPADLREITLLDAENDLLVPYRFVIAPGGDRRLESGRDGYRLDQGFSGQLAQSKRPLIVQDIADETTITPAIDRRTFPLRSYLGVPLLMGQEFIGTIELASYTAASFRTSDLELLTLISGQAAVAIHNALLYQQEQRRSAELNGLAQLAQAFGSIRDPKNVYDQLVKIIQPLIRVRILGFLLYNEINHTLEGQAPFVGIPAQFMEMYRIRISANSPLEKVFLDQDVILTENANEDPRWSELGLEPISIAAGLKDTVLMPLATGGRMMGYLQASNHVEGSQGFSKDELHLLMIVANQVAPIIDNAALLQQSRQRAQRAEGLRRIASLSSSAANLDEILKFSLQELARLLQAELAMVFLMDKNRIAVQLHQASCYGKMTAINERNLRLMVDDPQFPFTAAGNLHSFRLGQEIVEKPLIPFYQQLISSWGIESLVVAPLVVRDEGIGEVWLASRKRNFFEQNDMQVAATAAGQLAGVVERGFTEMQTDETLRRRIEQMTALTRITRELSTSLDLKYLLQLVYDEALRTTRADCGSILFFDLDRPPEDEPDIRFYVGDKPAKTLSTLELQVLEGGVAYLVPDVDIPDFAPPHDRVKSCLLVPIYYQERPGGLISLHSDDQNRFDTSSVEIAQSLAAQAAIALSNAVQFEEQIRRGALLQRQIDTLSELFQVSDFLRPDQPLERALEGIAQSIVDATPFRTVLISVFDSQQDGLVRITRKGIADETWDELRSRVQPWRGIQQLLQEPYKVGKLYYIPADQQPLVPEDVHTVTILPASEQRQENSWDADDFLLAPLYDSRGAPLGLISVDDPRDTRRPDRPTLDALEIFAIQAGLVIENYNYTTDLKTRLHKLEFEHHQLEESEQAARQSVPKLLHRQVEQTNEASDLFRQIERVRSGLEMVGKVSQQNESRLALKVMAQAMMDHFGMETAMIAERNPGAIRLLEVIGNVPAGANPEALFGQRNPLRHALQDSQLILVNHLTGNPDWNNVPFLSAMDVQSFVVFPFEITPEHRVAVLACGTQQLSSFSSEDQRVYAQLCRQISVSLQNLELLAETRQRLNEVNLLLEFSQKIGSLDQKSILNTLVENALKVLPSADAAWVGLVSSEEDCITPLAARGYLASDNLFAMRYPLGRQPASLPVRVVQSGKPALVNEINFSEDYNLPPDDLLRYRAAMLGRLPVSVVLAPIQHAERVLGVLVLENFDLVEAFSVEHQNLALSLAQQTALALENARLYIATEQRTSQLQALTQVSRTITSNLRSDALIATLLDQLQPVIPFDTATLWLRDGENITVVAAKGFSDDETRVGITARVEDSAIFQEMTRTAQAISVPDVRRDSRFTKLLMPDYYSWLGIPLLAKSVLIGVIALEKVEAGFFGDDHIQASMTFAGQAAVALENARLYEESINRAIELDQRSSRLALLNRFSSDLGTSLESNNILNLTCERLVDALEIDRVAVIQIKEDHSYWLVTESPAIEEQLPLKLPALPLFERMIQSQGIYNSEDLSAEDELAPLSNPYLAIRKTRSVVLLPLITGQDLQGWLLLQSEQPRRFSSPEIELARTISNQAAIALQNAERFDETRRLKDDLEKRVEERTAELTREHRNSQTMLRITAELSNSLDLQHVLTRTLAVLNETMQVDVSLILMANRAVIFQVGDNLETHTDQQEKSIVQQVHLQMLRERKPVLIADIHAEKHWHQDLKAPSDFRSLMAMPLIVGEEILGTLMLLDRKTDIFSTDQHHLVQGIARQIAITLNNAELFNVIRDQSEHLGSMLREQQIESSRSRGILEAVADGVVVTDAQNRITLFNASAERILDVRADQVIGKELDRLTGLLGGSGSSWRSTIQNWSKEPTTVRAKHSLIEQITLENDRTIAIHLAPVIWRTEFLGTVSIFRDITQEVQVDRLKSEFIANVSHELRTPLTSIKGYVEIMLMGAGGQATPQQEHFLRIVRENSDRLTVLVNDLLDVSRIQSGRIMLDLGMLDLRALAQEVLDEIRQRAQDNDKPMHFELNLQVDPLMAYGDMERTRQVLRSLVNNGYNYTPANGKVSIHIHEAGEGEIQVDVVDTGIGISAKDKPRIFDRFYRGEDPLVLATPGTGLGLALAKILVEIQGGRIWFDSSGISGEGSKFSFTLPASPDKE